MKNPIHENLLFGFGVRKPTFGGIIPDSTAKTVLIMALIPLDASECPMFVLTPPTYSGSSACRERPNTLPIAEASIGSPTLVPVP